MVNTIDPEQRAFDLVLWGAAVAQVLASRDDLDARACILGTRAFIEVASYFGGGNGVCAEPMSVLAANAEALAAINDDIPVAEWGDDAWSVGVDTATTEHVEGSYPAHLVAMVDDRWLVDTTIRQFSRPQRGMTVPDTALVLDTQGNRWGGALNDVAFFYKRAVNVPTDFRSTRNWRSTYGLVAASAIRLVRSTMEIR
jgi:hypothetical protein